VIKAEFSASLLQSLVSHDPSQNHSNMMIIVMYFIFQDSLIKKNVQQHLFELGIFHNIANVSTVNLDSFNALMNTSIIIIYFFILLTPNI